MTPTSRSALSPRAPSLSSRVNELISERNAVLQAVQIRKTYAGREGPVIALQDFSLDVQAGEFVAVRGPSGSGKTTLLLVAGGLLCPDAGQVLAEGEDLYAMTAEARAR